MRVPGPSFIGRPLSQGTGLSQPYVLGWPSAEVQLWADMALGTEAAHVTAGQHGRESRSRDVLASCALNFYENTLFGFLLFFEDYMKCELHRKASWRL